MLVSFAANARNLDRDIETYRLVLDAIRRLGHTVTNDWVTTAEFRLANGMINQEKKRWGRIASEAKLGIEAADLVIVEATDKASFGVGYEAALALQLKKPCLFLVRKGHEDTSYASGVEHELITRKSYDNNTLERLVEEFLKANTIAAKDLRFNFVIDRQIYNHLRNKSHDLGKTKAEIVRDLLLRDIDTNKT